MCMMMYINQVLNIDFQPSLLKMSKGEQLSPDNQLTASSGDDDDTGPTHVSASVGDEDVSPNAFILTLTVILISQANHLQKPV